MHVSITPGLDLNQVANIEHFDATVVITDRGGTAYELSVTTDRGGIRHADASGLPSELIQKVRTHPPTIDNLSVWKQAAAAKSFEDMKLKMAKETLRQLETRHFDATLAQANAEHLEEPIKELQSQVATLEKEAVNG